MTVRRWTQGSGKGGEGSRVGHHRKEQHFSKSGAASNREMGGVSPGGQGASIRGAKKLNPEGCTRNEPRRHVIAREAQSASQGEP